MQTQYCPQPLHHQSIYDPQGYIGLGTPDTYLSAGELDLSGFSRGSSFSYPHQDYQHYPDRGGVQSRLCSMSECGPGMCATGISDAGNSRSNTGFFETEGITDFSSQQRWRWDSGPLPLHGAGQVTVPRLPRIPPVYMTEHPQSAIKSSSVKYLDETLLVLSPTAQRPTPASMAVLLKPESNLDSPQQALPGNAPVQMTTAQAQAPLPADTLSREKKHGCTMCHKRFDRPSTLRKHLLVHTGEKAFVCETCGRRFGVASNLNRHVRKCILKPVNAAAAAAKQVPVDSVDSRDQSPSTSSPSSAHTTSPARQPRDPNAPKRRRRAPSPSRWVPPSLLSFNLSPPEAKKSTTVPLPPVHRSLPKEERDSWDENVSATPYHPRGWKDVLPGPGLGISIGLGGRDLANLNLSGSGGTMLGKVLVF